MKFRPLQDRVLIRRIEEEEKTAGGIIIPDTAKEKPMEGEVIAAGPGTRDPALQYSQFSAREPDLMIGSRCGTVCALRCAPQDPRFQIAARNQSPGRLEPAAQSTPRVARKRWKSCPKEDLAPAYIRRLSRTAASWCRRTWR